jgi:hypothetical protein
LTTPAAEVTVAVNVTVELYVEVADETVTVVFVAAGLTVWLVTADGPLPAKLPAPV